MPNHTKLEFDTLTSLRISNSIIIIIIQIEVRQTKIENFTIKKIKYIFYLFQINLYLFY